jgi:GWxTD domain-containing protein
MDEFFKRVDYSEIHFKSIGGDGGAKSDRGKIYLKYGESDITERYNDSYGKVIESWFYKSSNKKFLFIDKNGTGTYTLVEG